MTDSIQSYLLCQLAQGGRGGLSAPTGFSVIVTTGLGGPSQNQLSWNAGGLDVDHTEIWSSTDGVTFSLLGTSAGTTFLTVATGASNTAVNYYQIRFATAFGGFGSFSAVLNIPFAVNDWYNRAVNNNGAAAPSQNTLNALVIFFQTLMSNNLLSGPQGMIAVNCYVPDNLICCLTPQFKTAGNDPWTNFNGAFVAGDLTINGLKGDASTKALDTGLVSTTIWSNNGGNLGSTRAGISLYTFDLGAAASGWDVGANSNLAAGEISLSAVFAPTVTNNCLFDFADSGNGRISFLNTGFTGFTSGSRTKAAISNLYHGSSTIPFVNIGTDNNNVGGTPMPANSFVVHGYKSNVGVVTPNSNRRISFCAFHLDLDGVATQNLFNAVQAFRVAIGGGFV
jgi:hypothetical protein